MSTLLFEDTFDGASLDTAKWNWSPASGVTLTVAGGTCTIVRPNDAEASYLETVADFTNVGSLEIEVRQKCYGSVGGRYYYHSIYYGSNPQWSAVGFVKFTGYESALATTNYSVPPRTYFSSVDTRGTQITDPTLNTWFVSHFTIPRNAELAHQYDSDAAEESSGHLGMSYGKVGFRLHVPSPAYGDTATTEIDYVRIYGAAKTYLNGVRLARAGVAGTYVNGVRMSRVGTGTYLNGVRTIG